MNVLPVDSSRYTKNGFSDSSRLPEDFLNRPPYLKLSLSLCDRNTRIIDVEWCDAKPGLSVAHP